MERRLLLAILLTFVVLTVYQWMLPKTPPDQTPAPNAASQTKGSQPANAAVTSAAATNTQAPPPPVMQSVVGDTAVKTGVVDNGVVHAVFTNRGATLAHWQLGRYHDDAGLALDLVAQDVP